MSDLVFSTVLPCTMIALVSGLVHGYSGFGGALLMIPLLSLFLAPLDAVAVTVFVALLGQIPVARQAFQFASWGDCVPFLLGLMVAIPLGMWALVVSDVNLIRKIVGITTIAAASVLAIGWAYKGPHSFVISGFFGSLCGLLNGLTGQGGPVAVTYFMSAPLETRQQRATIVVAITGMIALTLVALIASGSITNSVSILGLVLGPPYVVGVWSGSRLFEVLPKKNHRRVTLALLFGAGIAALANSS